MKCTQRKCYCCSLGGHVLKVIINFCLTALSVMLQFIKVYVFVLQAGILSALEDEDIKLNTDDRLIDCITKPICIRVCVLTVCWSYFDQIYLIMVFLLKYDGELADCNFQNIFPVKHFDLC